MIDWVKNYSVIHLNLIKIRKKAAFLANYNINKTGLLMIIWKVNKKVKIVAKNKIILMIAVKIIILN
jgi:hypothetical protein